ncbi:hypothetical protein [Actinoplanes sp. URMC 104]|uniref:hypothetical protein n=1 Tax=Actinoplanes sp. URMC 104 TaxID=3423409 RepID=UPI003F1B3FEF
MTAPTLAVPPAFWSPEQPDACRCDYAPVLTPRKAGAPQLVKAGEPAYEMAEKRNRDYGCLDERIRPLARDFYPVDWNRVNDSRNNTPGWPDWVAWTEPLLERGPWADRFLFMELKRMDRSPEPEQVRVLTKMLKLGHAVYLVRPCCLLSGRVDQILGWFTGRKPCSPYWKTRRTVQTIATDPDLTTSAPMYWPPDPVPLARKKRTRATAATAPAAAAKKTGRLAKKPVELPGWDEPGIELSLLHGYVVPIPTSDVAADAAYAEIRAWLNRAGFPTASMTAPLRIIVGRLYLAVLCPTGLASGGKPAPRVWRYAAPTEPFPAAAAALLSATAIPGSGDALEEEVERWNP